MLTPPEVVLETGLDAAAIKPAECSIADARHLPFDRITIDYEGTDHLPDRETLADLARHLDVRITAPIRADGFDPLGDDGRYGDIPDGVGYVFVAGHPAYLTGAERRRAIAPRLGAAVERFADAWVGTEGVARVALATGATQFELLAPTTERDLRAIRAAGFDGGLAVYAPVVLTRDENAVLDALGAYVARRRAVRRALPADARTDAAADGRAREALLEASGEYALTGDSGAVREKVDALRAAGADHVVGYPARGLEAFGGRD